MRAKAGTRLPENIKTGDPMWVIHPRFEMARRGIVRAVYQGYIKVSVPGNVMGPEAFWRASGRSMDDTSRWGPWRYCAADLPDEIKHWAKGL